MLNDLISGGEWGKFSILLAENVLGPGPGLGGLVGLGHPGGHGGLGDVRGRGDLMVWVIWVVLLV